MPKRILIVRLSSIGDVLHCTPVARTIKETMPECHITWIVGHVPSELLRHNPYIDELIVWPREQWEKALRTGQISTAWKLWQQLKNQLATLRFDVVLDVHGLFLSGMVTALARSPRRIGLGKTREFNHLFMTETAPYHPEDVHVIQRYLSILRSLSISAADYRMTLELPEQAVEAANSLLGKQGITPSDRVIAVNPMTTWPAKNWPPEYFAEVIRTLQPSARIVLCGGPSDRQVTEAIRQMAGVPVVDTVGHTSLLEMGALIQRADLLLVGDTGPLHMAVALGTPTVSMFGPTTPCRYGPLEPGHTVLTGNTECIACHKTSCKRGDIACLRSITPAAVVQAIQTHFT